MKIILSLFLSFLIVIFLNQTIFFNGIPKINAEKIRRTAKNIRNDLIIFKNNLKYRLSKNKVEYNQLLSDYERPMSIEFRLAVISPTPTLFLMPIAALVPTQEIPIVGPTNRPSPTLTSWPAPTIICTGQACLTPMKI
ncbi:MAG: hypothetical protein US40_C0001G0082 [Candidatus Roizmanbacteria bacterium GW2011_GWC2_37_13]|uniref:Uncharacterized protein n=1 Tax=Candidatus Roizmanbacteria bacterium GW2011_GWC2_37_13 TaxID=1618486 RepID=A0A0G0G6K2_9BACT|nr:MAG: hypothetical protein US40_C0001G0082 [Candidatus Roizmanbacteria bacterium GW2011_GWC2_37_13]